MKHIICKACGKSFSISPDEEMFYTSKGLQVPKRCKECRKARKEQEKRINADQDEKELQRLVAQFEQKPIEFTNPDNLLGRLNYSMFLNPYVIDMWIDVYGAYDPDCQTADFTAVVEETDCVCKQDWLKDVTFFRA